MYHSGRLNAWTHLIGMVAAYTGTVRLMVQANLNGNPWKIVGVGVYGAALTLLYNISTTYHSVHGRAKVAMHKFNHLSIYLLIAGSYTPSCLVTLRGPWGWTLFGIVWGLTVLGMLQEIKPRSEARVLSVMIYAVMGWIVLITVELLLAALGSAGFTWLVAGGVLYTVGIVFYVYDHRFRHWHGIQHLFVTAGSLLHFMAIWRYVFQARSGAKQREAGHAGGLAFLRP